MAVAGNKALRGRTIPGRERLAGKSQRAGEDGWEYYSDGTVAIPIFDGTPNKASWSLYHILSSNAAGLKDGYEIVDLMRDGDRFYAIANGSKVVVRASPSKEAREKFLSDNGFKKGVKHPIRPITLWTKGDVRVTEENIHFGKRIRGDGPRSELCF